jgi:hypothetical protein
MNDHDEYRSQRAVDIVAGLEALGVQLDYDVTRIGPRTWGIHGYIAYDGEVLAAIFQNEREAWVALSPLRPTRGQRDPR